LVVLSSCNQGQTGPHAFHPGYGSQLSALAGFVQLLGEADSTPVLLYGPYIDYIAVGYGAIAVLAALERRARTGEGCTVDLSQYEAGLQFLTPSILEFAANGRIPGRAGNTDLVAAPHGVYRCAGPDRWVALSVWSDQEWRAFREATGLEGAATAEARRETRVELDRRIEAWTATRDRDEVVALLRTANVRVAPVLAISELFSDPQLAHRAMWPTVTHGAIGAMHVMAPPFRLSGTPSVQDRPGPLLGADNDHVFGELLGLSAEERQRLERDGVFR
jgi:crotonobetainyl-CoA:carnitine CoA-transferase CaiB-like acyl-CoA transferase